MGSVLLTMALIEIFLIYVKPVYIHTITSKHYTSSLNPILAYEPRPLVKDHNADGIRADKEYLYHKPDGVFRIVVIGDSIAYGVGVKSEETYAAILEDMLNRQSDRSLRYEVINLGVPGYRITQIIERLKTKGLKYDPDLIIYGYWLNDIWFGANPNEFRLMNAAFDGIHNPGRLVLTDDISEQGIKNFLLRSQISRRVILMYRSMQYRKLKEKAETIRDTGGEEFIQKYLPDEIASLFQNFRKEIDDGQLKDIKGYDPFYGLYADYFNFVQWNNELKAFAALSEQRDIKNLLLITPVITDSSATTYHWQALHEFIANTAAVYNIPSIDLLEAFCSRSPDEIGTGDVVHPNANGHNVIAAHLYAYLIQQGF